LAYGFLGSTKSLQPLHEKFVKLFDDTVSGHITDPIIKLFNKSVMNALTGRLGLRHPHVSAYTNFVAYNTIVAAAHHAMSKNLR